MSDTHYTLTEPIHAVPPTATNGVTLEQLRQLQLEARLADERFKTFVANPQHRGNNWSKQRRQLAVTSMKALSDFKQAICSPICN